MYDHDPLPQAAITQAVSDALAAATPAGQSNAELARAVDQHWVVYTATLVLFMQAGFAMLEVSRRVYVVSSLERF